MTLPDPSRPPRFCANCGAQNLTSVPNCAVCGQPLIQRQDLAQLWGATARTGPLDHDGIIESEFDVSSQATTPFTQTRPFDPLDDLRRADAIKKSAKVADPWSSSESKIGHFQGASTAPTTVLPLPPEPVARSARKGPPGFVMGCVALLLIGALAVAVVWGLVRSTVADRVQNEISAGITTELRRIDTAQIPASGQIVLTEAEINADLDDASNLYSPVEDVQVNITKAGIEVDFSLYGVSSTYRSGLAVTGGNIVAVEPKLTGPAGQIIDIEEITSIFEIETHELLRRSGVAPVNVSLRDGSLLINTKTLEVAS